MYMYVYEWFDNYPNESETPKECPFGISSFNSTAFGMQMNTIVISLISRKTELRKFECPINGAFII